MKKIILTLFVTLILTSNSYAAGSSSSGSGSSSISNYDKAVKLIKSAKKYEQKENENEKH